jgi:peptide-methionine (S)-S-oxide reductase
MKIENAIFGTGCFWCTEAIFQKVKGVISTKVGYAGGDVPNPTYEMVCSGITGHAEVMKIEFDSDVINYKDLLEIFWQVHDPTTLNRQGNDIGTEYRSIILYLNDEQKTAATESRSKIENSVTEVKKLDIFYPADDYHSKYFENHKDFPYCKYVILPKLKHFEENASLDKFKKV